MASASSWSSRVKMRLAACGFHRSCQLPVIESTLSVRQPMPVL